MKTRRNTFPKPVLDRKYLVGHYETTFREFVNTNLYEKDVQHISINDVRRVVDLEIGESIFVNIVEVKRLT